MKLTFAAAGVTAGIAASIAFTPRASFASGFLIYDLSGEAIGRASAVSAESSEPAAVWFNPAQLPEIARTLAGGTGTTLPGCTKSAGIFDDANMPIVVTLDTIWAAQWPP